MAWPETYPQEVRHWVLFRKLLEDFVHVLAWLCPWCPEMDCSLHGTGCALQQR